MTAISPLAPARFPDLPPVPGVRLAAAEAQLRYRGRPDLLLASFAPGTAVAGTFTRSSTAAPPVQWCRALPGEGEGGARALVVNAGNANAATGAQGLAAVRRTAEAAARLVGCRAEEVYVCSTGVIGEQMPVDRLTAALPGLHARLAEGAWAEAAAAIMTTDTFPKGASARAEIAGEPVTLAGIAKGSGMIAPDMATMLAYVFTDAALPAAVLRPALRRAVNRSFNAITVDGDTSTNDTCLLFATGAAHNMRIRRSADRRLAGFRAALEAVLSDLARQIVRDGEGARKFVSIAVSGAASEAAARRLGLAIANSPLVKTALAGEDPNWGRIVAVAGRAGVPFDQAQLAIWIGAERAARGGVADPAFDEPAAARHMQGQEVEIAVEIGAGPGTATVWTCDLTHGYIDINADYRS
ncbi:MAG: bifunctional glutamate N-acetyltransferase/amino-acid acetyltransferase ArgJ [Alphaproteobacteria bacterium]|nr:bifunctional glutamate N-acetyltransferase/amino-acid acetyltransferase ArgJ [Alphaproteobacteria bacterium]